MSGLTFFAPTTLLKHVSPHCAIINISCLKTYFLPTSISFATLNILLKFNFEITSLYISHFLSNLVISFFCLLLLLNQQIAILFKFLYVQINSRFSLHLRRSGVFIMSAIFHFFLHISLIWVCSIKFSIFSA